MPIGRTLRMKMAHVLIIAIFLFSLDASSDISTAEQAMKKSDCLVCHTPTQRLVGPSFQEISDKYGKDKNALSALIKSVKEGSQGKWGAASMPPHAALSEADIKSMIEYILKPQAKEEAPKKDEEAAKKAIEEASPETIAQGADLFQGKIPFQNRGPTCISCHHVKNDAIIGGGILAKDLTSVFSRLGGSGVRAILGSPPFPVMEQAYKEKPLAEEEIHALLSFLHHADKEHYYQMPRDYGLGLLISGLVGTSFILCVFLALSFRRRKKSINQAIYDRQVKSE